MSVYSPAQGTYGQPIGESVMYVSLFTGPGSLWPAYRGSVIYVSLFTGPGSLWPAYRGVCDLCQSIHRPREPMASL